MALSSLSSLLSWLCRFTQLLWLHCVTKQPPNSCRISHTHTHIQHNGKFNLGFVLKFYRLKSFALICWRRTSSERTMCEHINQRQTSAGISLSHFGNTKERFSEYFNCRTGICSGQQKWKSNIVFINFFPMATIHSESLYVQMESDRNLAVCTHDNCMAFRWAARLIAVSLHCTK